MDYVKRYMGAPTGVDVEAIRAENDNLKKEVAELKSTIEDLNARVGPFASPLRSVLSSRLPLFRRDWRLMARRHSLCVTGRS